MNKVTQDKAEKQETDITGVEGRQGPEPATPIRITAVFNLKELMKVLEWY